MLQFTDRQGFLHIIPVREVRRLTFGEALATLFIKGARFDTQINLTDAVARQIKEKLIDYGSNA